MYQYCSINITIARNGQLYLQDCKTNWIQKEKKGMMGKFKKAVECENRIMWELLAKKKNDFITIR